jgi:hypothetical protein
MLEKTAVAAQILVGVRNLEVRAKVRGTCKLDHTLFAIQSKTFGLATEYIACIATANTRSGDYFVSTVVGWNHADDSISSHRNDTSFSCFSPQMLLPIPHQVLH